MPTIHLSLQGKGGVGKSFLALMIAMYYHDKNIPIDIFDTDPINATVFGFSALKANQFEIMKKDDIDKRSFDKLFTKVIQTEKDILIDIGSNGFISICSYILSNELIQMLHSAGHRIIIHTSIVGGQNFLHTINGFHTLAQQFPTEAEFAIWLNPFWGEVIYEGKRFEDLKAYKSNKDRISAILTIPEFDPALHGLDLAAMLEQNKTFNEAINGNEKDPFDVFSRHRLKQVQNTIYSIIETARIV